MADATGSAASIPATPARSLLAALREDLELTAAKSGCHGGRGRGHTGRRRSGHAGRNGVRLRAVVDRDNLTNQVEGATVMALGGALFEGIHLANGRVTNASLRTYRVPRFHDVPPIEVILLDRPDLPSEGAGEAPLIAVAPAIANGIARPTGRRMRSMPLAPDRRA